MKYSLLFINIICYAMHTGSHMIVTTHSSSNHNVSHLPCVEIETDNEYVDEVIKCDIEEALPPPIIEEKEEEQRWNKKKMAFIISGCTFLGSAVGTGVYLAIKYTSS